MKISINKTETTATFIIVLLMTSAFMIMIDAPVQAQYTNQYFNQGSIPLPTGVTPDLELESISHLSFSPNPVGGNQQFIVNMWVQPPIYNCRKFSDFKVTITKPSGAVQEIVMDSYMADGTAWFQYIADEIGTWTLKFDFPGGYFPSGNYTRTREGYEPAVTNFEESVYYRPSSDGPYDLEVIDETVYSWPEDELPTDYWTRPVSAYHREWWPILGNWPWRGVGGGDDWPADTNKYYSNYRFTPYVQGPESAHVVWERLAIRGGLIGGDLGPISYWPAGGFGSSPEQPDMIFAGMVYQGDMNLVIDGVSRSDVWQCYDLRTGEVIWQKYPVTQEPTYIVYTERNRVATPGEEARKSGLSVDLLYVGQGRYIKYDPWTGAVRLNASIAPLTSGTLYADPWLLTSQNLGGGNRRLINWTVGRDPETGQTHMLIQSNITWPFSNIGDVQDFEAGIALDASGISSEATGVRDNYRLRAASLTTGAILWDKTTDLGFGFFSGSTDVADHGKYAVRFNDGTWHCWDLYTGNHLWQSEISSWPWSTFGSYDVVSAYGYIFSTQYDGVVAIDWDTGKVAWHFEALTEYPYETPYQSRYPFFVDSWVADGKFYTYADEHSISQPIYRGLKSYCLDAMTGEEIWSWTNFGQPIAIADGYLISHSLYDGYQYVIGRGESETTVQAPKTSIPKGTALMIEGTVLDLSPAQPGTACVSKESMGTQMDYLHMQMPIDSVWHNETITGVPVTLTAIGSDGSVIDIGTTTTNGYYGTFGLSWTPTEEGTYEIIASFEADESYGSSGAATYVTVGPAPSPAILIQPVEPVEPDEPVEPVEPVEPDEPVEPVESVEPEEATETPFITTEIVILAVVAIASIIGAVSFWALKKRK